MKTVKTIDQAAYIQTRCAEHGIYSGAQGTPQDAIPRVRRYLAEHDRIRETFGGCADDLARWGRERASIQDLLLELEALVPQPVAETEIPVVSGTDIQPQPLTSGTNVGQSGTTVGQPGPNPGQTSDTQGQPGTQKPSPAANESAKYDNVNESEDDSGEQEEAEQEEDDQANEEDHADEQDDAQEEDAEYEDEEEEEDFDEEEPMDDDDYDTEAERLADLRSDLINLRKKRNKFDALTAEQKETIMTLAETYSARALAKVLAEPAPTGMNFRVGKSTIARFVDKQKKARADQESAATRQTVLEIVAKSNTPADPFHEAAERMLKVRLLEKPDASLTQLDEIVTILTKLQKHRLAEARPERN